MRRKLSLEPIELGSCVMPGDYCIYISDEPLDERFKVWSEKRPLKCLETDPWGAEGEYEMTTLFEGEPEASGSGYYGFAFKDYLLVRGYNRDGFESWEEFLEREIKEGIYKELLDHWLNTVV